jgi:hypothetical protein
MTERSHEVNQNLDGGAIPKLKGRLRVIPRLKGRLQRWLPPRSKPEALLVIDKLKRSVVRWTIRSQGQREAGCADPRLNRGWFCYTRCWSEAGCRTPRLKGGWFCYSKAEGKLAVLFRGWRKAKCTIPKLNWDRQCYTSRKWCLLCYSEAGRTILRLTGGYLWHPKAEVRLHVHTILRLKGGWLCCPEAGWEGYQTTA